MNEFMKSAADKALLGMEQGLGGPFGAVIVRGNEVISCEHNRVLETNDPTMHAEIAAIRAACKKLGRFSLHDCEIYSTCMPCPMCLSAIMWAKIPKLYYGTSAADAAKIGFDDEYMYEFIRNNLKDTSKLTLETVNKDECAELFARWENQKNKNMY
jgi:guanine deaminase